MQTEKREQNLYKQIKKSFADTGIKPNEIPDGIYVYLQKIAKFRAFMHETSFNDWLMYPTLRSFKKMERVYDRYIMDEDEIVNSMYLSSLYNKKMIVDQVIEYMEKIDYIVHCDVIYQMKYALHNKIVSVTYELIKENNLLYKYNKGK